MNGIHCDIWIHAYIMKRLNQDNKHSCPKIRLREKCHLSQHQNKKVLKNKFNQGNKWPAIKNCETLVKDTEDTNEWENNPYA